MLLSAEHRSPNIWAATSNFEPGRAPLLVTNRMYVWIDIEAQVALKS